MGEFYAFDWYWIVGDHVGDDVFSSASRDYIPAIDDRYFQFVAKGNVATPIDTEFNLGGVLAPYGIEPIPPGMLEGYQAANVALATAEPLFDITLDQENRIRALEGQPPVTRLEGSGRGGPVWR